MCKIKQKETTEKGGYFTNEKTYEMAVGILCANHEQTFQQAMAVSYLKLYAEDHTIYLNRIADLLL